MPRNARPSPRQRRAEPWFELRRSPIQGRGAFALRRIRRGTRIIEYAGERISHEEADERYDDASMKRHHTFLFTLDDRTVIDGGVNGNDSRFINHCCEPNCEAVIEHGRIYIYALSTIYPGDELTYDYAYEWGVEDEKTAARLYVCRCGAPGCRGTILKRPERQARQRRRKRGARRR